MKEISGKVAVVTGAGSGIGRAIAMALAGEGASLVISDIRGDACAAVRDEILAQGGQATAFGADVASIESVQQLADAAYHTYGQVDILCNNAGVNWRPFRRMIDATLDDWTFMMGVNCWGVVHGMHVFLPRMCAQPGEKHVVNTGSLNSVLPLGGNIPYSASKAAVASITEAAAQEFAENSIGFTLLAPGAVQSGLTENSKTVKSAQVAGAPVEIEPYESPKLRYLLQQVIPAEHVGQIVKNAILRNQLYVYTHPWSQELVDERIDVLFGASTKGIVN